MAIFDRHDDTNYHSARSLFDYLIILYFSVVNIATLLTLSLVLMTSLEQSVSDGQTPMITAQIVQFFNFIH